MQAVLECTSQFSVVHFHFPVRSSDFPRTRQMQMADHDIIKLGRVFYRQRRIHNRNGHRL